MTKYTYTSPPATVPPIIHPSDFTTTVGSAVPQYNWTENAYATRGVTTSLQFGGTGSSYGTTNGNVAPLGANNGMTNPIASSGGNFTAIGWTNQNLRATDTSDNSTTDGTRKIIVRASQAPSLEITYASGAVDPYTGLPLTGSYTGSWTNQPLDIKVASAENGSYDATLFKNGAEDSFATVAAGPGSYTKTNYITQSPVAGDDFTGQLLGTGDHSITLSPATAAQTVKIDTTNPTPGATYAAGVFTDTSADALSGIDASRQQISVVTTGNPAPASAAYESFSTISVTTPGYYDVYVWAWDNAGNNVKSKVLTNIFIKSTDAPTIAGEIASGIHSGDPHPSATWTNQDVKVTVTPPASVTNGYSALYDNTTTLVEVVESTVNLPVDKTYTAETASTVLYGVIEDSSATELTNRTGTYEVKIDKTAPTADATFNAGVPDWGFVDASYDNGSVQSLVNPAETAIAFVTSGGAVPVDADYTSIAGEELPATGYWDVYVKAVDFAGNVSTVKAFEHISRSLADEITAKDFSYDIAHGAASLDDAMAKMLSHVFAQPYGGGTPYNVTTDVTVDATELAAIQAAITAGQKGTTWPLTFSTPAGTYQASTTINVTIFDAGSTPTPPPPGPLNHEMIYANNFNWGISTGSISDVQAKVSSNVTAYDVNGDPMAVSSLTVDTVQRGVINAAIAAGQKDTNWPLTFYTPDNTAVTILVTLFDNGPVNPPLAGDESIVGNDFNWGISTGSMNDAQALFLAAATATSATGAPMAQSTIAVDPAQLADINAAIAAGQQGTVWPLTFTTDGSTGNAASTTVEVTLYDAGPLIVVPGDEHVVGNDFGWGISTGALDDAASLVLSKAYATGGNGKQMPTSSIIVDPTELADINAAIAAGQKGTVWPLTLTTKGLTGTAASAVIYVTLYDNGPAGPFALGSEHIVGNNFNWGISTGNLDVTSAQVLSRVKATSSLGTEMPLSTISADAAQLADINAAIAAGKKNTVWPLTFTTDGSTGTPASATVYVTLYDNGPAGPFAPGNEHIVGNDFKWGIDSGSLSDAQAAHLAKIAATGALGIPMAASSVSYDSAQLADINDAIAAGKQGTVWPLTFTTDGSTGTAASVTVYVTLFDAGHPNPVPGDPYIVANHFSHPITSGALSNDDAKAKSLVSALASDGTDGALADIQPDATELAAINAEIAAGNVPASAMPLTFSYTCPITNLTAKCTAMVTLTGASDLVVTKTVDNANPLPGEEVTYTITAKNSGVATIQGLWIKDNLPSQTVFVSCDAKGVYGSKVNDEEYVHWFIPSLAAGQEVTMTLTVRIKECSPGTVIENIALYQEGVAGLPSNLDSNPQGGQTDPASATVGDNSNSPTKLNTAKTAPRTGDMAPYAALAGIALMAFALVLYARRRIKQD